MSSSETAAVALSLKHPWAALVVAGLKTIEIRRWPTVRRGRILIHAARISDTRPEAWLNVPGELDELCRLCGGIIGSVEIQGCKRYTDLNVFTAEQALHWNQPDWFTGPVMYGFEFTNPQILPFRKYPGWFRFFSVKLPFDSPPTST